MADDPAKADKSKEEEGKGSEPATEKPNEEKKEAGADLKLPEKFQGKSPEEIAKAYIDLEKKLGEQSEELGKSRETQGQINILLDTLWSDQELYKQVETAVKKKMGGQVPAQQPGQKQEAGKDGQATVRDDQRSYLESRIISEFQSRHGLEKLPPEERQKLMQQVSNAWATMLDPKGRKTREELLAGVELDVLPTQLDNAYWITRKDVFMEKGKLPAQDYASFGSMPSSSGKSEEGVEMTPKERTVAEKLGVDPEKYVKRKQQIKSENK